MRTLTALLVVAMSSCAGVSEVRVRGSAGQEIRPGDGRQSVVVGVEIKMQTGVSYSASYRFRMADFADVSQEHGVFASVSAPIWIAPKKPP